jgi:hypothetical protein
MSSTSPNHVDDSRHETDLRSFKHGTDAEALEKAWMKMKKERLVEGDHGVLVFRKKRIMRHANPRAEEYKYMWNSFYEKGWAHVYSKDDPTTPISSLTEEYKRYAVKEMVANPKIV